MEPQTFKWPRCIGGPLHGEPIPETTDPSLVQYAEPPSGKVTYYMEQKFRFGRNIAVRFLMHEGSQRDGYDDMMQDVIIHALATVGITVQED